MVQQIMTRDERKEYMLKYRKYKNYGHRNTDVSRYLEETKIIDERTMVIRVKRCQWHRCNKILTMTEKLYGNNCAKHSIGQTPNIDNLNKLFK